MDGEKERKTWVWLIQVDTTHCPRTCMWEIEENGHYSGWKGTDGVW